MEAKKVLHAVKKEEGRGAERPKAEITKWALHVSGVDYAELIPLNADQVKAIARQARRPAADPANDELPEKIIFCNGVKDVKRDMHIVASEMAEIAQILSFAVFGLRESQDLQGKFEDRELMALHNTADVIKERAQKFQALLNALGNIGVERRAEEE